MHGFLHYRALLNILRHSSQKVLTKPAVTDKIRTPIKSTPRALHHDTGFFDDCHEVELPMRARHVPKHFGILIALRHKT